MQMANDCARRFEGQDRDSFMSPNPCFARCVEEALRWTEEEDQNDNAWTSHVARPLCKFTCRTSSGKLGCAPAYADRSCDCH
jgi:hypothetical protein